MKFSLNKFLSISKYVAGPVLVAFGLPPALVAPVQHGIEQAEIASAKRDVPLTGAEKREMVLEATRTAIAGVNAIKPGSMSTEIPTVVGEGIDVVIHTINVIGKGEK